jgi:hypothetical protein
VRKRGGAGSGVTPARSRRPCAPSRAFVRQALEVEEDAPGLAEPLREVARPDVVRVEVGELERGDLPVGVLAAERQVDHADGAVLDQTGELWRRLGGEPVPGKATIT